MIKKIQTSAVLLAIVALLTSGCASQGGYDYSRSQQRSAMQVQQGVVTSVQEVNISNDPSVLGPLAGGVAGGVLGSLLGGGKGRVLTTVGGAAGGALAGAAIDKQLQGTTGLQILVRLDNGQEIAVVQDKDNYFKVGDRVRVMTGNDGTSRVQLAQ